MMLLVGDIGGTKTNLAVYSSVTALREPVAEGTFPSARYSGLEEIVRLFLEQSHVQADRACFGVAGPIVNDQVNTTNLPWIIRGSQLKEELKLQSVVLMNDLESIANAVPFLLSSDLYTLHDGQPAAQGSIGVIAPGTGLGEAFITWDGAHYVAHTSEGGHADFAPTNETQIALLRYLQSRFDHVSYEWICSGIGLPNIYGYLKESGYAEESVEFAQQLEAAKDLTPIIVNAALNSKLPNPLCTETLNIFVSVLAAEAGNLALKVLSTGGIYIGGGIPPRILPFLQKELFMQAFLHKGRFAKLLTNFPIHVILNPKVGLLGAAYRGFELAKR